MQVTVQRGDSIWRYSQLFQIPLQLVIDSNPGLEPQMLYIGQTVQIPGYMAEDYRIAAGDTLWNIAAANGISVDLLMQANNQIQPYALAVGQLIRIPRRVTGFVVQPDRPYNYQALLEDLERLASVYPFMRQQSIGSSVMGKSLPGLTIGNGPKAVHFNASIHANEWITTPVLIRFVNEYLLALTNNGVIRGLSMAPYYSLAALSVVPMLNPDGVDLVINGLPDEEPFRSEASAINEGSGNFSGWKANIRGVDLNKQFPALWERDAALGPQAPAPRDYSGTAPLTEPEVQALAQLTRERDFNRVLAFHTQGKVIYWGFQGLEPPESEVLADEFARVSGYESVRFVDSTAGYKDWFIQDWRRPGFTIEFGEGINPLPLSQLEEIYQAGLGIMLAALYS